MRVIGLDAARGSGLLSATAVLTGSGSRAESGSPASDPPAADARFLTDTNVGFYGTGIAEASLTPSSGMTVSTNDAVIDGYKFTGTLIITGTNVTVRNCLFLIPGGDTYGIRVRASGATIEDTTWVSASPSTSYYIGLEIIRSNCAVTRCYGRGGENIVTLGDSPETFTLQDSFFDYAETPGRPSAHPDVVEVYGGSNGIIRRCRIRHLKRDVSPINCAPWGGASVNNLLIEDNYLQGGQAHILIDLQSSSPATINGTKILRNYFDGQTSLGDYNCLQNNDGRAMVATGAEQSASPGSIMWPSSGADANYWYGSAGLTPDKSGTIAMPL